MELNFSSFETPLTTGDDLISHYTENFSIMTRDDCAGEPFQMLSWPEDYSNPVGWSIERHFRRLGQHQSLTGMSQQKKPQFWDRLCNAL